VEPCQRPVAAGNARAGAGVSKTFARVVIALAGLGVAAYLLAAHGIEQIFRALVLVGWSGLGAVTLLHAVSTLVCALAWWLLLRPHSAVRWPTFIWVRWLRDGLDSVVPILPVGGELIGMRMLALRGVALADAGTVADLTAELLTQALFAAIGLALLHATRPQAAYQTWIAVGVGVMALQYFGFLYAQRKGLFRLIDHPFDWLTKRARGASVVDDEPLHERILTIYRQRRAVVACLALHLAGWIITGLEVWVGLWFMGRPRSVADVLILESLVYALRSIAFFVPLGAGVQEGGYVLIGGLLGIEPSLALAVALLKRGRDLLIGAPALLCWQLLEARHFRRASAGALEPGVLLASAEQTRGAQPAPSPVTARGSIAAPEPMVTADPAISRD
jgi:putative membrane protein